MYLELEQRVNNNEMNKTMNNRTVSLGNFFSPFFQALMMFRCCENLGQEGR